MSTKSEDRYRANSGQKLKLLDLLSKDGVLAGATVVYMKTTKADYWKPIAKRLNAIPGGCVKNPLQWCKMWTDWKVNAKRKANKIIKKKINSETPTTQLTKLETRLLKLIGYPIENYEKAMSSLHKVEIQDDYNMECLNEEEFDDTILTAQSNIDKEVSDNENKSSGYSEHRNAFGDMKPEDGESSDDEYASKNKEKLYNRRKESLEEYKIRTTLMIQKERMQQKSEELRLKALELELKAEELKLNEMEMNKMNFLTNIEEEKLKCFREISSSLKVLLEHTSTGILRFQNIS